METKEFKKLLKSTFELHGFARSGNHFYKDSEEIIGIIGLQKSNFSNGYYINVGYFIKQLKSSDNIPRDVDAHVSARFLNNFGEASGDVFELDLLDDNSKEKLVKCIDDNVCSFFDNVTSINALKDLLTRRPSLLYQTKLNAKRFLGYS